MKKKSIVNLIRYYASHDDESFRNEAYQIARDFDESGDSQLAHYIMSVLSGTNIFLPQDIETSSHYFQKLACGHEPLYLPKEILADVHGIENAAKHLGSGVNKFLFEGAPGTGKTETVKQLSRLLQRDIYSVNFETVIDCKMGQTSKNIADLFSEIKSFPHPEKAIVLFDEIDSLALDRINSNDLREMGRATSTLLKELDGLDSTVLLIATTNLYNAFDKALIRRFDSVIDFNRYSKSDLTDIAVYMMNDLANQFPSIGSDATLFRKILSFYKAVPYPGDMKNILRTAVAFSDPGNPFDYLKRLFTMIVPNSARLDEYDMKEMGFTIRQIAILRGKSKSDVDRLLRKLK